MVESLGMIGYSWDCQLCHRYDGSHSAAATFSKGKFKRRIPDTIALPAHCAEFSTKSEQQRPADIIAFPGRYVPSSMAEPLFKFPYDMAPCRSPRASMARDKVRLLRGWKVNARSCRFSVPLGPSRRPKRDTVVKQVRTIWPFGYPRRSATIEMSS